ncbi:hypothetical protein [Cryptosporangium aurantiacum]|uniref:Dioxygenase n=1 Tax=Cryptosporangium aurantiacum TaxID=134849 RepID=A0A1M7JL68_9ACTN|nr:hypothetical protein [Cryptosporangium aurantiacum]SHM53782.1 hypothetical protein SAMN05443668_101838 [Cryptosporangium aurantiacum]
MTYLRGYQVTDASGKVTFTTIVPGWYSPRVAHIHLKVHQGGSAGKTADGYDGTIGIDPSATSSTGAGAPPSGAPSPP